jgi:hypothetical protein
LLHGHSPSPFHTHVRACVRQGVNVSNVAVVGSGNGAGVAGAIVGPMWQMVDHYDPVQVRGRGGVGGGEWATCA